MFHKYIKILIISVFVILVSIQAGKSFVLDELDFPIVSHATSQTAKPIYYRGESSPQHVGTYHPTLYINSLAVFIKAFGYNETSIRFFGIMCTLLSAYLLILILRQLIRKKSLITESIFLGLFLLNPYTIANTTLPDIDSTILPLVLLLFIYCSLKYLLQNKDMSNKIVMLLSGLFALALWSKLTTPLILPVFLVVLAIITSKDYKKSILFTIKVTLLGSLTFIITYLIYCKLLNLSTTYTYHFLIDSFTKGTSSDGRTVSILNNLKNLKYFVFWPTLPMIGLFVVSYIGIMLDNNKDEKTKVKKVLVSMSLLVTIFYIALISPFGGFFKYPYPVYGLLIMTVAFYYERYYRDIKINKYFAIIALLLGFILEKKLWGDSMFINSKPFGYLFLLIGLATIYYLIARFNANRLTSSIFVLFIFFTIGFQLSISRVQATSPYSTKYLYGQTGLDQATAYLKSNTEPDEIIWAMKDVGYYVNNKYVESYSYYFDKSLEKDLMQKLDEGKIRYYIVTTGIGQDNIDFYTDIKTILNKNAKKEKQFGNFVIYKVKE